MSILNVLTSFLIGMFSLFITGNVIWADEDGSDGTHQSESKSSKVKKKVKSATVALDKFTCQKQCKNGSNKNNSAKADENGQDEADNNTCSNKKVKSYSESDNDGITTDRSWDGDYNHKYTSNKAHKVLICRNVNMNENFDFGDGNDTVVVKGSLAGGNNFNLGGGDDIIAISGSINGNVSIDGGAGVDVIKLIKPLTNYTFQNFTNNNGIISAQIVDKTTGQKITINNMDGAAFKNGVYITPVSGNTISGASNVLRINTTFSNGIGNVQIVNRNGKVYVQYNGRQYDAVVFKNGVAIVGSGRAGVKLLWREE